MKSWHGQVAVIAAALLMFGFCPFDSDHDGVSDHGMSPDLCAGMLVSSLALVLLVGPLVNGQLLFDPVRSVYTVWLHLPDPPPKLRSLV